MYVGNITVDCMVTGYRDLFICGHICYTSTTLIIDKRCGTKHAGKKQGELSSQLVLGITGTLL